MAKVRGGRRLLRRLHRRGLAPPQRGHGAPALSSAGLRFDAFGTSREKRKIQKKRGEKKTGKKKTNKQLFVGRTNQPFRPEKIGIPGLKGMACLNSSSSREALEEVGSNLFSVYFGRGTLPPPKKKNGKKGALLGVTSRKNRQVSGKRPQTKNKDKFHLRFFGGQERVGGFAPQDGDQGSRETKECVDMKGMRQKMGLASFCFVFTKKKLRKRVQCSQMNAHGFLVNIGILHYLRRRLARPGQRQTTLKTFNQRIEKA